MSDPSSCACFSSFESGGRARLAVLAKEAKAKGVEKHGAGETGFESLRPCFSLTIRRDSP